MTQKKKLITSSLILIILWVAAVIFGISTGTFDLSIFKDYESLTEVDKKVLFGIRLPRILLASIAGGTLAVCGAALQAMFRNPLASPFTLGVSGGASLGALIAIRLGLAHSILGFSLISVFSFVFSILTILFVYSVSKVNGVIATGRLLLAGVVMNFLFSAFILFIQFFSKFTESLHTLKWIMGSLDIIGFSLVWKTAMLAVPACLILISMTKDMNIYSLGNDVASSLGVNIKRMEMKIYFATSLAAAAVISVTGPIGFVGLFIPHIIRMIIGVDNRILVLCSFLLGASFLTITDTISRTIRSPVEIPVGIVTAFIGGIFFLWLLVKSKKEVII
ncbi:MAG: iron ABC transporter permease [Candidatus Dadabacteria bacterium]|nr:iron ABC transporter permease [Candidatus Dadabacteria bacterium]NIS08552.1 iron ABC transporter permease [Candidatus Dadabacteria bacterium]NIV41380.1 iron chelate uptake ABC transporter family permease subunit [Candidatus Dadabacteria bacterium]NIX14587.1 iron chelate uptake ABC transporter family permease subunit [Candidatus Dadabacteria bacterium]NIY21042.1 iron chelate uptake ABC transporter family permease subunit [Candidatus Dadabacteria bacterium]